MKVGLLYDLRNPQRWFKPFLEFYVETMEQVVLMEQPPVRPEGTAQDSSIAIGLYPGL